MDYTDLRFSLGMKIIDYRARHHMTQAEFADRVGVSRATIITIEKHKRGCLPVTEKAIEYFLQKEQEKENKNE